jgi:imidazolonepropionase-like amidohydrolase
VLPDKEESFEAHRRWLPVAEEAGVPILLGDDFGLGWMPHGTYGREFLAYKELGIAAQTAIKWATHNGAVFCDQSDRLGSIAEGNLADLVVVKGDLSQDIGLLAEPANILAVMKDGQFEKCLI